MNLPVIHRLGMETVPGDESADIAGVSGSGWAGGRAPSSALGLHRRLSTRLFEWP